MTKIGQYEILQEIGRGEMSIVYLAHDEVADREVAVKMICLPESLSEDARQEVRSRFLAQATATLSLSHPGIITTYYCHERRDEPEPFISMEYVAGRSLKALFRSERPEPGEVFTMVEAVADALHKAHRVGVFHGDVNPGSVFVRRSDDVVKVGDFGIGPLSLYDPSRITADSAAYAAPERLDGNPADACSDLFSLAVILYQGLCGKLPFQGEDAQSTMAPVMHSKPDPVTDCVPGMPTSVDGFFARALAKDPDHRFPDAMSFLEELQLVRKDYESSRQGVPLASINTDVAPVVDVPELEIEESRLEQAVDVPAVIAAPVPMSHRAKIDRRWLIPAGLAAAVALSFFLGWMIRGGGETDADVEQPQRLLSSIERSAPERPTENVHSLTTAYDGDSRRWDLTGESGTLDPALVVELDGESKPETQSEITVDESLKPISIQVVEPLLKPAKKALQPSTVTKTAESTQAAPVKPVAAPETVAPKPAVPNPAEQAEVPKFLSQAVAEPAAAKADAEAAPAGAALEQSALPPSAQLASGSLLLKLGSSIKQGTLFLFLDGDTILKQRLAAAGGRMKRMVKQGEGSVQHVEKQFEIPAGEHSIQALVHRSGKGKPWRKTIIVQVKAGQVQTLKLKLGRIMGVGGGISLKLEAAPEAAAKPGQETL